VSVGDLIGNSVVAIQIAGVVAAGDQIEIIEVVASHQTDGSQIVGNQIVVG